MTNARFSVEFRKLRDRLLRIEASDPKDGHRYVIRVCALAGKAVKRACDAGLLRDFASFPWPTSFDEVPDESEWWGRWWAFCYHVSTKYPARFPPDPGVVPMKNVPSEGVVVRIGVSEHQDWRQRAEDFAAICDFLADVVETEEADAPSDRSTSVDSSVVCRRAVETERSLELSAMSERRPAEAELDHLWTMIVHGTKLCRTIRILATNIIATTDFLEDRLRSKETWKKQEVASALGWTSRYLEERLRRGLEAQKGRITVKGILAIETISNRKLLRNKAAQLLKHVPRAAALLNKKILDLLRSYYPRRVLNFEGHSGLSYCEIAVSIPEKVLTTCMLLAFPDVLVANGCLTSSFDSELTVPACSATCPLLADEIPKDFSPLNNHVQRELLDVSKCSGAKADGAHVSVRETEDANTGGKQRPAKRSWTQAELDEAILEYKAKRASTYKDLVSGVKQRRTGAEKSARKMFGRNAIARELRVKSNAMVTKSPAGQEIADELGLRKRSSKSKPAKKQRIGMDIALEETGVASSNAVVDHAIRHETIKMIERSMPTEVAEATIEKLQCGDITEDAARELVELSVQQQQDERTRKLRQAP